MTPTDWPMNEPLFLCRLIFGMFDGAERLGWNVDTRCCAFLPDVGTVLKVIALHSGNSLETEEVTLEELQVFKVSFHFRKWINQIILNWFSSYWPAETKRSLRKQVKSITFVSFPEEQFGLQLEVISTVKHTTTGETKTTSQYMDNTPQAHQYHVLNKDE